MLRHRAFGQLLAAVALSSISGITLGAPPGADDSGPSSVKSRVTTEFSSYGDTDHVTVLTPSVAATVRDPLVGWSAGGSYLVDIVSAASVDIISTASGRWNEVRHAATLHGEYKPETLGGSVAGAVSSEPDYLSLTGGGGVLAELESKTVTPRLDYSYSRDTAGRTGTPFSVYALHLERHTLTGSLGLLLDRETSISLSADAIFEKGQQEKPYRYVPIFAPDVAGTIPAGAPIDLVNRLRLPGNVAENTPDTRQRYALSGRLAQRLADTTFILFERIYADSWGMRATTTDLRMVFDASDRLFFWPHFRAHFQTGVSFWKLAYVGDLTDGILSVPKYRTGDREQSPLASASVGAGVHWNIGSDDDPSAYSLLFLVEGMTTRYSQALFIDNRYALFGSTQFQATF